MRIVISNETIDMYDCESLEDIELVRLVRELIETDELYRTRHNGYRAATITDMIEHIND